MNPKKRMSIEEAAQKLTDIWIKYLKQFPEDEQEARSNAFVRLNFKTSQTPHQKTFEPSRRPVKRS